jgi:antitoxin HigA-1
LKLSTTINFKRPLPHPGEILREELMAPYSLTASALAKALRVDPPRIYEITREKRAITADTALRLEQFFGISAEFWLRLQASYDLSVEAVAHGEAIKREIQPRELADA